LFFREDGTMVESHDHRGIDTMTVTVTVITIEEVDMMARQTEVVVGMVRSVLDMVAIRTAPQDVVGMRRHRRVEEGRTIGGETRALLVLRC
jgi:hypothetical protein